MSGSIDYASLRDQTLVSGQDEEAVTVNTRALIDKVLARYSGEWTTLRELIQNAADASATKVVIRFETLPSSTVATPSSTDDIEQLKHVVLHHTLRRLVVSNNGQAFNTNDWARLKRIAEGNPDETKIGAFGVGFYSVFADCENPFIASGSETMAFYWKGNSLFTRKGNLPKDQGHSHTSFVLDYRNNTSPVPSLKSICQFLSTSLTFVGLESVELWLDDYNVFTLTKKSAPPMPVTIPKGLETKTKEGMMRVAGVESQTAQIDATWINIVGWMPSAADRGSNASESDGKGSASLRSFFSRLAGSGQTANNSAARKAAKEEEAAQKAIAEDLMGISQATIFIRINNVHIKTQVSNTFAVELERATKKPPPKTTKIAILTSSYDETTASLSTLTGTAARNAEEIITSVMPRKNGRIFIGFPTAQTTGLLAHISAPSLIPTVERENIDLNARYVRTWNTELLSIAGIACRIAFAGEMATLHDRSRSGSNMKGGVLDSKQLEALIPAATHALKQFTFQESTPLSRVAQIIEESFWTCNKNASIDIFSSCGVLPSHEVRIASESLSFVNRLPVIPEALLKNAGEFITKLQDLGLVSEITTSDIKKELEKQALTEEQLDEFLKWASSKVKSKALDAPGVQALIAVTIVTLSPETVASRQAGDLLVLRNIDSFVNSGRITPDMPMPPNTIPFKFTKNLVQQDMNSFGWSDLQIVPWVRWLLEQASGKAKGTDRDMTDNSNFSGQVLAVISRSWDSMSQSSKSTLTELLVVRTIIPTKSGMKRPPESYFASVKLFDDLPTISGLNSVKEKFLKALGVRKTIELSVIFQRLMAGSSGGASSWSHVDLIKYLVGVWQDIPGEDIEQLKKTPLCPAEGPDKQPSAKPYKLSELFEPKDSLRGLGLQLLQWPTPLNVMSPEGKFLKLLGLRANPSVPELVNIAVKANRSKNAALYENVLKYFIESHYTNNYASFDMTKVQAPFLPLQNGDANQLVKPEDCFTNAKAEVLSYPILRNDLHGHAAKFGVQKDPPIADAALRLIKQPPRGRVEARRLFGYFAERLPDITPLVADKLKGSAIVPVLPAKGSTEQGKGVRLVSPTAVFVGSSAEYEDIFDFVDFGEDINLFLQRIGSAREPTVIEVANLLVHNAMRTANNLGMDKYKGLLYKLHINMPILKKEKALWSAMKTAPFLLALKERPVKADDVVADQDDATDQAARGIEYRLKKAGDIVINDDLIAFSLFKQYIVWAPQEDQLETLYWALGSPYISTLIDEEPRFGAKLSDQATASHLKDLIIERAQLFLHDQPAESITHNARWLEKNLEVENVGSISLRRTLRGRDATDVEKRSAALSAKGRPKLFVTAKYDPWQVSQEVVQLLLDRPRTQQILLFETFLTTDLYKLRARGYNVDRILRQRAMEERRAKEAEQKRLNDEKQKQLPIPIETDASTEVTKKARPMPPTVRVLEPDAESAQPETPKASMPGAFHDSPLHVPAIVGPPSRPQTPRGIISSISRHFGFDQSGAATPQNQIEAQRGQSSPTTFDPNQFRGNGTSNGTEGISPDGVLQSLQSAVTASRPFGSSSMFNRPTTNTVQDFANYCDERPGHDLTLLGTLPTAGLKVYLARSSATPASASFLRAHSQGLEYFATVLLAAASVFPVAKASLHIFHDDSGKSIAFNQSGSLFFNYRFFAQLHLNGMSTTRGRGDAIAWWWTTMCHELAHNLVQDHSSGHSYWTESFVSQYFQATADLIAKLGQVTQGS